MPTGLLASRTALTHRRSYDIYIYIRIMSVCEVCRCCAVLLRRLCTARVLVETPSKCGLGFVQLVVFRTVRTHAAAQIVVVTKRGPRTGCCSTCTMAAATSKFYGVTRIHRSSTRQHSGDNPSKPTASLSTPLNTRSHDTATASTPI